MNFNFFIIYVDLVGGSIDNRARDLAMDEADR